MDNFLWALFSTFPFMVCLCWFVTFLLRNERNDSAKRVLTFFLGTCTVLYLCHAFFFNGGLSVVGESLWTLCSLLVYPLYFIYICRLTCRPLTRRTEIAFLLPGACVALGMLVAPGSADMARKAIFALQVFSVLYFGYRRLMAYDREVENVYADTEGRDTSAVKLLLVAFVATSMMSTMANAIGKQYFVSNYYLGPISLLFGVLLYALSYIGYMRNFSPEQFAVDITDATVMGEDECEDEPDSDELGKKIDAVMDGGCYLVKNLKITDMAREAGTCRTYVSNYINKTYNMSFSDYVNQRRVEHAKHLLQSGIECKMTDVAERSGFSSVQSFYRNFKKFVGMTPAEWLNSLSKQ